MPIQVLECPSCSGNIDFYDETKLFGRCTSCGREVQRTEPEKIIIQGSYDDSNQVIKQGMDHLELNHFQLAEDLFKRYIEKNPKRYEGYYGMLLAATRNFDPASLDDSDEHVLSTIDSHMLDVSKTADSDTTKLIRERLEQFYVDYKDNALKEINEQIDSNEEETDALKERIERDRRELSIDSLESRLRDAEDKRKSELEKWDRIIAIVTFIEKHRKFIIWLIVLVVGGLQKGPGEDGSVALFAVLILMWLAFIIGFPILCLAMRSKGGNQNGWYPIAKALKKKKDALADELVFPGSDMRILDDFEDKKKNLKELQDKKQELLSELSKVSKMDTKQLMKYRAN